MDESCYIVYSYQYGVSNLLSLFLKMEVVYFYVFIYLLSYNGLSKSTLQGQKKNANDMYLHHNRYRPGSITSRCLGK